MVALISFFQSKLQTLDASGKHQKHQRHPMTAPKIPSFSKTPFLHLPGRTSRHPADSSAQQTELFLGGNKKGLIEGLWPREINGVCGTGPGKSIFSCWEQRSRVPRVCVGLGMSSGTFWDFSGEHREPQIPNLQLSIPRTMRAVGADTRPRQRFKKKKKKGMKCLSCKKNQSQHSGGESKLGESFGDIGEPFLLPKALHAESKPGNWVKTSTHP